MSQDHDPGSRAGAILAERYAHGEISTEEHQDRLDQLSRPRSFEEAGGFEV